MSSFSGGDAKGTEDGRGGEVNLASGNGERKSGNVEISTLSGSNSLESGSVNINTGSGELPKISSGSISIGSASVSAAQGHSGSVTLSTGDSRGNGKSGRITLPLTQIHKFTSQEGV